MKKVYEIYARHEYFSENRYDLTEEEENQGYVKKGKFNYRKFFKDVSTALVKTPELNQYREDKLYLALIPWSLNESQYYYFQKDLPKRILKKKSIKNR